MEHITNEDDPKLPQKIRILFNLFIISLGAATATFLIICIFLNNVDLSSIEIDNYSQPAYGPVKIEP